MINNYIEISSREWKMIESLCFDSTGKYVKEILYIETSYGLPYLIYSNNESFLKTLVDLTNGN